MAQMSRLTAWKNGSSVLHSTNGSYILFLLEPLLKVFLQRTNELMRSPGRILTVDPSCTQWELSDSSTSYTAFHSVLVDLM